MNHTIFFPPGTGSLGLTVRECGHQKGLPKGWLPVKRIFSTYVLSYIAGGSAWYQNAASKRQFMPRGSCVVFFPGIWSFYSPCDYGEWEEHWIHFEGPVGRLLESEGHLKPESPVYRLYPGSSLLKYFQESVRIGLDRSEKAQKRLTGRLLHILNEVLLLKKDAPAAVVSTPVHPLMKRIQQNPAYPWDFHSLARDMNMTYARLISQFRKIAGRPPCQFVNIERMKLACQFLARGHTVQETCVKVGMDDPFHFSRLFKQVMGKAPVHYRPRGASPSC